MRTHPIFKFVFLLLLSTVPVNAAFSDSSITNSYVDSLNFWVRQGETFKITQSHICQEDKSPCVIFVDEGSTLKATNSRFGKRVTIYKADGNTSKLKMVNTEMRGQIIEGRPEIANFADSRVSKPETSQRLTNKVLNLYEHSIPTSQKLVLTNTKICPGTASDACLIRFGSGSSIKATNVIFGAGVRFESEDAMLDSIKLTNSKFFGSYIGGVSATGNIEVDVSKKISTENAQLKQELASVNISVKESARGVIVNLPDVFFEFDSYELTQEAYASVKEIGAILSRVKGRLISIEGHTDSKGSDSYNQTLSKKRAQTVEDILKRFEIDPDKIHAIGFGEKSPIATNVTEGGRAKNRRVEVIIENSPKKRQNSNISISPNGISVPGVKIGESGIKIDGVLGN